MTTTITYLDGTQFTSSALSKDELQIAMQIATAQMLGIILFSVDMALAGTNVATPVSMANLAVGQILTGSGIPAKTTITAVGATTITLSNAATSTGTFSIVVAEPDAFSLVRIGWQTQGQPAWGITDDVVILRGTTIDNDYSRMRDIVNTDGSTTVTQTDTYTRRWRVSWTFYGPNSLNRAGAVRSALAKIKWIDDLLAQSNLYVDPSIPETPRVPERYQGQWWERVDLVAMFNEQVTETTVVNADASVEIIGYTKDGQFTDFTVQLP